jgi:hypothetical protein
MANARINLSGTPASGRVIPVVAIATPGTTIHTAHATSLDALYLWAANVTDANATLTIEWGGVLNPGDHIFKKVKVRARAEPRLLVMGQHLTGSLVVKAFSDTASAINISGFCLRYT